jgi:hypothetical protein
MGTEIATANPFGNKPLAVNNRAEMAKKAAESAQAGQRAGAPDGSDYMNFSGKTGVYTIGQDKRVIQEDELWVLNIASFQDGYVCWKGGKPASTRMYNIYNGVPVPPPAPDELGPFNAAKGEGWYSAKGWVAKSLDEDQQGYFKNNSVSGVAEMADMIEEVSRRMAVGQPCWPVFHYSKEAFEAQGFKNFKPIFKVYGWLDDEALGKLSDEDVDIDELIAQSEVGAMAPSVGKQLTKAAEPDAPASDPAEDEEDAPTARRRRRRSA